MPRSEWPGVLTRSVTLARITLSGDQVTVMRFILANRLAVAGMPTREASADSYPLLLQLRRKLLQMASDSRGFGHSG